MNLLNEIKKIHNDETNVYEHWNEEAAENDFLMPLDEDLDKVEKTFELIKNNLELALDSKHEYIRKFGELVKDQPEEFQASSKWLDANWDRLFPQLSRNEAN